LSAVVIENSRAKKLLRGKNPDEYWTKNSMEEKMEASIKISFKNSISRRSHSLELSMRIAQLLGTDD
jgi:hypothetical protein